MAKSTDFPPGNTVTALKSFSVSPDFSAVDLKFAMLGNDGITLRMSQDVLHKTALRLGEILTFIQSRTPTSTGHLAVHASEAVDIRVGAPAGGGKVIVQIVAASGMIHNFAVPRREAARFGQDLKPAIERAEAEASATRQ